MNLSFDFEKPIAELIDQLEKVKQAAEKSKVDVTATIKELEEKIELTKNNLYNCIYKYISLIKKKFTIKNLSIK